MSYQKYQASQLFTGSKLLGNDQVLITNSEGKVEDILPIQEAGDNVQAFEGILCPGFVNTHCHLELSHLAGKIPANIGLVDFILTLVKLRPQSPEAIQTAIVAQETAMLANGIVAVGDICNGTDTLFQKTLGRLPYANFIEVFGTLPAVAQERFKKAVSLYESFKKDLAKLPGNVSIVPHAPYTLSENLWKLLTPSFAGQTISMHHQESPAEDQLFYEGKGDFIRMFHSMYQTDAFFKPKHQSSTKCCYPYLKEAKQCILVHNSYSTHEDISWLENQMDTLFWCLCVNANLYIENTVPPIDLLRQNQCKIIVGTDSLASNWSLSILDELKTIHRHFPKIPLAEILQWATLNGAEALCMKDQLGSFEKGKQPGVLILTSLTDLTFTEASTVKRIC